MMSNMVATSFAVTKHLKYGKQDGRLNFECLILINVNLNSYKWLEATILGSLDLDRMTLQNTHKNG